MMDMDPLTRAVVWRIDSNFSLEAEVGKGVRKQRRTSFKVTSKMCKRARENFVTIIEVHRATTSMRALRSDAAFM